MANTFTFSIPAGADHCILREALKAFADHLGTQIPALAGAHVGRADPEELDGTPCAVLLPGRFAFEPQLGVDELPCPTEGTALFDVGSWDGSIELRISSKFQEGREALEQAVINLFQNRRRRGTLILQTPSLVVNGAVTLYSAPVTFSLMSSSWEDEMVWEKKRYAYITIMMTYPALVAESGDAWTIDAYHAALTEDLVSADPVYEALATDEDGNITPQ